MMIRRAGRLSRVRTRQRGATALEYIAMVLLAGVVVLGLLTVITKTRVASKTATAVCMIFNESSSCERLGQQVQGVLEKALAGDFVQLGDSFASGEGAKNYKDGTNYDRGDDWDPRNWGDDKRNRCRRSGSSYADVVYNAQQGSDQPFQGSLITVACSGARLGADVDPTTTDDTEGGALDGPNPDNDDEPPQKDALTDRTSLVTLSIGGNDLGFASVLKDCMLNGSSGIPGFTCQETWDAELDQRLERLRPALVAEYLSIRQKAPNARVIVMGYPPLFNEPPAEKLRNLLYAEDQLWMNGKAEKLNAMLREVCREAGVEFIYPTNAFKGHGIGSNDPWINDMDWGGPGLSLYDPGSFHPNAAGHAAMAELLQEQLRDPKYP